MLDLLFVALVQAAAGPTEPAPPPVGPQAEASATAGAATEEADEDLDRVVCRREMLTGSNLPRRVCLTVRERNQLSDQAQDNLARQRRNSGTLAGTGD